MSNSIDISEVSKAKFKCFKFDDSSIYYGETEYVDESKNNMIVNFFYLILGYRYKRIQ